MDKQKIVIVGRTGFLGAALERGLASRFEVCALSREELNLENPADIDLQGAQYVAICAAITDVEACYKNQAHANQVNVAGTISLLQKIAEAGAVPIFFSSDYVFRPNDSPHLEADDKYPKTVYGKQKLAVENYIKENFKSYLIFRTSKLMSKSAHPKNILLPIVNSLKQAKPIKLFSDQWLNPVFVEDIAKVVEQTVLAGLSGEYHLGTKTILSRLELGEVIAKKLGLSAAFFEASSMKDIAFSEPRPSHNLLNCEKISKALDFEFCEVQDGLSELLKLA